MASYTKSGDDWQDDDEDDAFMDAALMDEVLIDEASWPVPLALVRAELLAGDRRALYLLWLLSVQCGERGPRVREPPRPSDMAPLTGSLSQFAEFLRLNPVLGAPKVKPSMYDGTVRRLLALQDLAVERGEEKAFGERLGALCDRHQNKAAFQRRVRYAGLTGGNTVK